MILSLLSVKPHEIIFLGRKTPSEVLLQEFHAHILRCGYYDVSSGIPKSGTRHPSKKLSM
jgi:hypothetical protein